MQSSIDLTRPLYAEYFPHRRNPDKINSGLLASLGNLRHILRAYEISTNFNEITKTQTINIPGIHTFNGVNTVNTETVISLAAMNKLPSVNIKNQIIAIAYENPINPVVEYLKSLPPPFESNSIQSLANCLTVDPDSSNVRDRIFRMFMIGACAAADHALSTPNEEAKAKFEYMMILVGEQGVEKTKFFEDMLPESLQIYFKDSQFLDPSDKDSVLKCMMYWINEIGEVDNSIFTRGENSRIKAFLSESEDVLRPPFGRVTERFHRRTIFVGSTNERNFLKDYTGSRRYWPIEVLHIKTPTEKQIDFAWSEAWSAYINGEQWWPDSDLEEILNSHRLVFNASITDNLIDEIIDALINSKKGIFAKDIIRAIDIQNHLKISVSSSHGSWKTPSTRTINKTMKQYNLGLEVQGPRRKYWAIHNIEKYKGLRPFEVEKHYVPPYSK